LLFNYSQGKFAETDHEGEHTDGDHEHENEEPNGSLLDEEFNDEDVVVFHPVNTHDLEHLDRKVITVHEDHVVNVQPTDVHEDGHHMVDAVLSLRISVVVDNSERVGFQCQVRRDH
jgi:hypothetical protein